jgi:hypothetical protein
MGKMKAVDANDDKAAHQAIRHSAHRKATAEYISRSLDWHDDILVGAELEGEQNRINTLNGSDFEEADDPDADQSDCSNGSQDIPLQTFRRPTRSQHPHSNLRRIEDLSETDNITPLFSGQHKRLHSVPSPC